VQARYSIATRSLTELKYQPSHLDNVEEAEKYHAGGFHPVQPKRYRVIHKLGFGGFSTTWLVNDEQHHRLVALKVLTAEASRQPVDLMMLQQLDERPMPCITDVRAGMPIKSFSATTVASFVAPFLTSARYVYGQRPCWLPMNSDKEKESIESCYWLGSNVPGF
jgi:serine/threonine protein kinase